jgi:hypothetical protein
VKLAGPPSKRTVGEIAPFGIEITNTATRPHTNVRIEALLDTAFERETGKTIASQGFWHDKGGLYYLQPNLAPGQKLKLEIRSKCLEASSQAIARVRVTSDEGARAEDETSCEIVAAGPPPEATPPPAESKLQMTLTCPTNPARMGKQFNCLITVVNDGTEDERDVTLEVLVPDGLMIRPLGTTGPDAATQSHLEIQPGKHIVRFDPLPTLSPNQPQRYRVLVQAKAPAKYTFQASLSSRKSIAPTIKEQSVDVTD